ncbi:cell division protein FtsL [Cohnella sp. GCM10027633]|uniref:cell division protein FtsL n=1 Tax=unclassified Cohnella TaxID=2636738 RepID=UPI0036278E44
MQYYGNLAIKPERAPEQQQTPARKQAPAQQPSKSVRRRTIPIGEKLLYLFTVAVVVLVACFIIYRYAQIYQMNGQIQETSNQYNQTTEQMKELQREIERLSDPKRIRDKAMNEYGMVPVESRGITVTSQDGRAVAMKP